MIANGTEQQRTQAPAESLSAERIAHLEGLVSQAKTAAAVFTQFTQEDVDRIVKPMVLPGLEQAQYLARLAIEETRLGVMEDKVIKNMVATEFTYNYVKDKRTVGVIREFPDRNLVEMAEPIGVIFSLTPITNPTSTVLFKCIPAIKTRNAVIFSPHPRAWRCSSEAVRVMYETAVRHGAPEGVFSCLESHTLEDNAYLMRHKDVRLIDATGGPGAVKAAYSSGKPALGVGAGNTAVYLEKTADLNTAAVDIIISKTFDNGTICASEQTVVIDDEIYALALKKFSELGAHICNEKETKLLERTVMDPQTGVMQPLAVGQKATDIARLVGLPVEPNTKLLIAPIHGVGREHPLSLEKLFPVLAVYRARSTEEALKVCVDVNHAGGLGHTAVIFSRNDEIVRRFSEVMNAGRIIVSSPGSIGALGAVYNNLVPTFSFGCGTGGGNSTTDNVNVFHYLNIKRVARRTQNHMWFRVPNQIYFNMNAVENVRQFPSSSTIIVTNPALEQIGHVDIVRRYISPQTYVHVLVIPDAEPEIKVVMQGVETLNFYKADQIIALGGRVGDRCGQNHETEVRVAGGGPGRAGRAFSGPAQTCGSVSDGKNKSSAADRHFHHERNRERSHSVCGLDRQRARAQGDAGRLLAESRCGDRGPAICHVHAQGPDGRYRDRLPDPRAGSRRFELRFQLHRLQRHASDSAGIQVPAHRIRESPRRRSAMHDAQRRVHCGTGVLERVGGCESCAGACLRGAFWGSAWQGQRADVAARACLQCRGAHKVHAVALSAGICGAQEVRGDGGPAGPRWSYG